MIFRYAVVGVVNTSVDWIVFFVLLYIGVTPLIANAFSWGASLMSAYILNAKFTFRASRMSAATVIKFTLVSAAGLASSNAVLSALATISEIWVAKTAATAATFAVTYLMNRHWTFRRPKITVPHSIHG